MITATPVPEHGSMRLDWQAAVNVVAITRTDDAGTAPVRTLVNTLPSPAGTAEDFEPALTGPIVYTATLADGSTLTSNAAVLGLHDIAGIVAIPQEPARRAFPDLITGWEESTAAPSTAEAVINREDALAAASPHSLRYVRATLRFASYRDAAACREIVTRGRVTQIRQPGNAGLDAYLYVERTTAIAEPTRADAHWRFTIEGPEQRPPAGPVLGTLGWDFATLAATYTDFAHVTRSFADFADLEAGRPL